MGRDLAERLVDHRKRARECVTMALQAQDDADKALWLTLAQSWVRLAEYVARTDEANVAAGEPADRQARSPERPEAAETAGPPSLDAIAPYWP